MTDITARLPIKRVKILDRHRPSSDKRHTIAEQFGEWREDYAEEQSFLRAIRGERKLWEHLSENGKVATSNKPLQRCNTLVETANR
jgi:hypothetical protein